MRFTCEKNLLLQGFTTASRTAMAKSSISALEGILCKAGNDGLSFTGYNMETAITFVINTPVVDPGECVLPTRMFGDILRRIPEGDVTVVVDEKFNVSVRCGFSSFALKAESADEYPDLPDVLEGKPVSMPEGEMKKLINGTIFSVSDNQARIVHCGVKFEVRDDSVTAVAVDGFRMARRSFHPKEPTEREMNFVVPSAGLKEVEKLLNDDEEPISFTVGKRHILFQRDNTTLICRLLEGEFLDWRKVIPMNSPIRLIATVGDLLASLERVGLIVSEKYKSPVRCTFSNQQVYMRTATTIASAEDRCSYAGDGGELEIGFNVRFLIEALRAIPSEEVTLELTDSMSPIVLTPAEPEKYDFAYMVLPVRIKG